MDIGAYIIPIGLWVICWFFISIIVAERRGLSRSLAAILSLFFGPLVLLVMLVVPVQNMLLANTNKKKCSGCLEYIPEAALKCKHCGWTYKKE